MWKVTLLLLLVVAEGILIFFWQHGIVNIPTTVRPCTLEVKICPDGRSVGREGPNCEFAACTDIATASTTTTASFDTILRVGMPITVAGMTLTLNRVIEDSRCPKDVLCIQVGRVITEVEFRGSGTTETIQLGTTDAPYLFNGYYFSIKQVTPIPMSTKTILPEEYRITIHAAR